MIGLIAASARVYRGMMRLYPPDLHRDFGSEMLDVFMEDLVSAIGSRGTRGAVAVWWCAIRDFIRIAAPEQAENRIIAVPLILFTLNEILVSGEIMLTQGAAFRHDFVDVTLHAAVWPSLLAALTALVVVIIGLRDPLCLLRLGADSCSKSAI